MIKYSSHSPDAGLEVKSDRLFYLDWLRVFAIIIVFTYHNDIFFDLRNYFLQDTVRSLTSTIHREFCQLWMMPLFFMISGASVLFSLKLRKPGKFIKDRFLRLFVPLTTIGLFIIASIQDYLFRSFHGNFSGTFLSWYPQYFNGFYPYQPSGNFAINGMHLWYLEMLFLYSLIFLPLFIPIGYKRMSIISRISHLFENPWLLSLLFLPLAASSILTDILGLGILRVSGGWDQFSYIIFFIYGYLIFSNQNIQNNIKKYCLLFLITAIVFTGIYLFLEFGTGIPDISAVARHNLIISGTDAGEILLSNVSIPWAGFSIFRSMLAWCWLLGLLGLGNRILNFRNKFLDYCNEAVLPFYILHMTIIYIIGSYAVKWNINIGIKYIIITTGSFAAIMIIYELLIKRFNILRFLFGMK